MVSLPLLLLALEAAARGRHIRLGVLAAIYTLSYSGFYILPILCGVWFVWEWMALRKRAWAIVLWPMLGTLLGLVVHPQFPGNIRIWVLQSVLRFLVVLPDTGIDTQANTSLPVFLTLNAGWLAALFVLWRSGAPCAYNVTSATDEDRRLHGYIVSSAMVFFILFLKLPHRFGLYLIPLTTIALLGAMGRRGLQISKRVRLFGGRTIPLAIAMGVALLLSATSVRVLYDMVGRNGCFRIDRETNARAFSQALPTGARVAATWDDTGWYAYWAPQGRYLNVLDPVFMAIPNPALYRSSMAVFGGHAPDVPLQIATSLQSEFLAMSPSNHWALMARIIGDPRWHRLHQADDLLLAVNPHANRAFVLDWRVAPSGASLAGITLASLSAWSEYPRLGDPVGRSLEGFVDHRRISADQTCRFFARSLSAQQSVTVEYELSSWGPAALLFDGQLRARALVGSRAVLGEGTLVPLQVTPGVHLLVIESCPAEGLGGFYLIERDRRPI
jgi:hypothetical protein